jgi:uncharacterized membrane protein
VVAEVSAAGEQGGAGNLMNPDHFLSRIQHHQIVQAIHHATGNTTGEIRVFIAHGAAADPLSAARHRFEKLKMHHHAHRNAILIFVAPRSQTFAVIGDQAVHDRAGDVAWQSMVAAMADRFKNNEPMSAIEFGIEQAGQLLTEHFPKHAANDRT